MQYTRRDVVAGLPVLMAFGLAGCKTAKATANNTTEATKKASEALRITAAQTLNGYAVNSTTADENTILVNTTDDVTITNSTVTKTGDSDGGDNCNFYGQNAAVLVEGGSTTTLTNLTVTSDAKGANGIFSYGGNGGQNGGDGDGTKVIIKDTSITTTGDGAGGTMTTGGGTTNAYNLTVTTNGQSSAAIRTDRGGGTVYVDGGTYTSNGLGSPAIYSTAEIHVANATLVSNLSEGVCIEGLNSIELTDCDLTANNTKCNGNATFMDTIMIYQSMSDDGWNGGNNKATFNAKAQDLVGAVLVGDNSTLALNLTEGTTFEGYVNGNIVNASNQTVSTEAGTVAVTLDNNSTWTLTADSYVTEFNGTAANVIANGHTLYVKGTALTGT